MARTGTTSVIARLLDDDSIHDQIGAAGAGVRDAYRRVRRLPPEKAVQDKTVYDNLRQAATGSPRRARRALAKPEPKPPRARCGLLVLVLLSTGAVVVWAAKKDSRPPGRSVAPPPTRTVTPTAGATAMSVPEDR